MSAAAQSLPASVKTTRVYFEVNRGPYAAGETYLPEGMAEPRWYEPVPRGIESKIAEKLAWLRSLPHGASLALVGGDGTVNQMLPALGSLIGIEISTATVSHIEFMVFGALIVWFLIVEPHGLAKLWSIGKQKLRLWPFPH